MEHDTNNYSRPCSNESASCTNYRDAFDVVASTLQLGAPTPQDWETTPSEWAIRKQSKKLTLCNGASRAVSDGQISPRRNHQRCGILDHSCIFYQGDEDQFPASTRLSGCAGRRTTRKGRAVARHDAGLGVGLPRRIPARAISAWTGSAVGTVTETTLSGGAFPGTGTGWDAR
jgi:hypothetical protein